MMWWGRGVTIPLGTSRFFFFGKRTLRITPQQAHGHMHVLGKTGSGKSYFLAGLFLSMHEAGMPATLIDPHGDLAELVLAHLVQRGTFTDPTAYDKLVYLDLPAAEAQGRYFRFNYLSQPYSDQAMAELVAEAFRRAWPELATGAPTFENILKHSVIALGQNQ
jgi:DNA helicase HerA-like ATPase